MDDLSDLIKETFSYEFIYAHLKEDSTGSIVYETLLEHSLRSYETSLSEISYRENIKLLAYSPLGYGALVSTKRSEGRFETYPTFVGRYQSPEIQIIVKEYKTLAEKNSITIEELALSFIASQPFVGSIIIGPATGDQLDTCLDACSKKLSPEILFEIEKIHEKYPNICA